MTTSFIRGLRIAHPPQLFNSSQPPILRPISAFSITTRMTTT